MLGWKDHHFPEHYNHPIISNGESLINTVCLCAKTFNYPKGGGHFWVYLNWALGLKDCGCRVIWSEPINPNIPINISLKRINDLKSRLRNYGLSEYLAIWSETNDPLPKEVLQTCLGIEEASTSDLLLNTRPGQHPEIVDRFKRTAFLDIDPGLLQYWISKGYINIARHDIYFTIGETVGASDLTIPDCGVEWLYTPPCVNLDHWGVCQPSENASFTTVSHWYMADEWIELENEGFMNDKRSGFVPFLSLPSVTNQSLELAINLNGDEKEKNMLENLGWTVREAHEISSTPRDFQHYIQGSKGEFSCAKPSCVRLQNAWISDRTLCYLASGKPAVIQHTGPSRFLPDSAGIFRFRDIKEAALSLDKVAEDYDQQCLLARQLAEEYFDSRKVVGRVLERALE